MINHALTLYVCLSVITELKTECIMKTTHHYGLTRHSRGLRAELRWYGSNMCLDIKTQESQAKQKAQQNLWWPLNSPPVTRTLMILSNPHLKTLLIAAIFCNTPYEDIYMQVLCFIDSQQMFCTSGGSSVTLIQYSAALRHAEDSTTPAAWGCMSYYLTMNTLFL